MGLLGCWWGVLAAAVVAALLGREWMRALKGDVVLTARQKVVRTLGGLLLMAVLVMALFSPIVMAPRPSLSRTANDVRELVYWATCLAMAVMVILMAVLDLGEISRQYTRVHREIRKNTLTSKDVERLMRDQRRDHPDDVGH